MSLCFRTFPNKFTSFVNSRKQVTKIDRQLPKHINSSFLEEFLSSHDGANTTTNFKERAANSSVVHLSSQNVPLTSLDTCTEWPEILGKKCDQNDEQIVSLWQHGPSNVAKLGISYCNAAKTLVTNEIKLENNVRWVEPVLKCNGFSKHNANESLLYDLEILSVNRILYNTPVTSDFKKQRSLLTESMPNVQRANEKQPERAAGRPSEAQLQAVFNRLGETLPKLFITRFDYGVYTPDVILINNIRGVTTRGINSYVGQVALLKIVGHCKFAYIRFDIIKMTMHPEDDTIKIRWRIKGIKGAKTFMFWKFRFWKIKNCVENTDVWYDGFSTYYVNGDGLIYKHVVDKMMPDPDVCEKVKTPLMAKLALFTALIGLDT